MNPLELQFLVVVSGASGGLEPALPVHSDPAPPPLDPVPTRDAALLGLFQQISRELELPTG
jgi:hypothetical protein